MDFVSIRIITDATRRLVAFYEQITGVAATWYTEDFAELTTPSCTLAIAHRRTMELFAAGAAHPEGNHSVIVEFRVSDVDAEYRKLASVIGKVVQEPTTMPWGNRSLLFRDPDGNLVNYFTPVSPGAIKKLDRQR
ncbi:VOC family protein [Sorangium sp. So ce726]|uniref:VOC family protein n=1 Tax=Sorangium sp. So ce726 TaxID=3133319 RepID=UPI003F61B168